MYHRIDENGFYLGISSDSKEGMEFYTETPIVGDFVKFKCEKDIWVEGASEDEINEARKLKVPFSVSKRQLKQALVLAGISLANIENAILQIDDETEKTLTLLFWNESNEFERLHPKLIEFSQSLGMSENQVDELFILASTL